MFGVDPNMQLPINIGAQPPQTPVPGIANMQIPNPQIKKRGGMFAGATINPGNFISGFLAGLYPQYAQSFLAPGMQRERAQFEQQQADAQSQRELQRQKDLYTFELHNPKPTNNDTANDYAFWQQHLTPEQFQEYVQNKISPPQYMNVPGVGLVQIPRGTPGATAAPTAPVGKLTPIGGQTPPASGGFPR